MKSVFVLLLMFILGQSALAYVPSYKMVMSRTAENHGRGIYQFYQDVVCPASPEPYVIREIWTVLSEDSLRLTVTGKGQLKNLVSGSMVYKNGQRYFKNSEGRLKVAKVGQDWVESFFHFRFSKNIKPRVVSLGMAPAESLKERKVSYNEEKRWVYEEQDFMRLARVGGRIAYAIGEPSQPGSNGDKPPGLWVEQDRFNVLQVRMPTGALVTADDYSEFDNKLSFPKSRTYSFGEVTCEVQLDKAVSRTRRATYLKILEPKSLSEDEKAKAFALPEIQVLREFYSRFR